MKIAFLGNFSVDYCSEVHYKKTLEKLGHTVYPLQEGRVGASDILDTVFSNKCDLFFWVHTHGWNTPGIEDALEAIKTVIPTVGYHLDLWLGIQREKDLETDPYWRIQYFFSVDKKMVDYLNSKENMPKAFFLPAGVFEDECYIGNKSEGYEYDVIFVGSKGYHPEWQYRPQLIEWLSKTYGNRFAHFGGDGKGVVRGEKLNDLYASAKVVVGDTLCKNFDYPYYLSDRIFETTGRGGFIIHPYIKGIEDLFVTNLPYTKEEDKDKPVEMICYKFGDFDDLKNKIDFFIEMDTTREAIKARSFERTKRDHTYTNRLQELLRIISSEQNK